MNLQYNMILEVTEQVEKLHRGSHESKLALDVANYVRCHLSEPISVEAMAEEYFLSRPYLSAKFKQDTGMTLTDFILHEKRRKPSASSAIPTRLPPRSRPIWAFPPRATSPRSSKSTPGVPRMNTGTSTDRLQGAPQSSAARLVFWVKRPAP